MHTRIDTEYGYYYFDDKDLVTVAYAVTEQAKKALVGLLMEKLNPIPKGYDLLDVQEVVDGKYIKTFRLAVRSGCYRFMPNSGR